MFWCDRCGTNPCPCRQTPAQQAAKAQQAQERHRLAVAVAAGLSAKDRGGWLAAVRWPVVHLFMPLELGSVCREASRRGKVVLPQGKRWNRCLACVQTVLEQEESR